MEFLTILKSEIEVTAIINDRILRQATEDLL